MPFGLKLKHTSEATPLPLVGLQVWNGALLLAEYISWRRSVVAGKRVVEVGAGTGVVSFVAAAVGAELGEGEEEERREDEFGWMKEDVELFHDECEVILAADVVYIDYVTFHFVRHLPVLLLKKSMSGSWRSRTLYLSLEKRIQFSVEECRATAPAWDFLIRTIDAMNQDLNERVNPDDGERDLESDFPRVQICMEPVDLRGMPKLFEYERTKELQIWKAFLLIA
ncbi:hypothetical protein BCR33DRAFT_736301 [Rhizoclosmatium globosum]|uniref:Uncharacterized protein n=1 Tax=Rhizoclosmatium globosum TaxID=329046 RepID=A0A1Y2CI83_9FUNG|nr:hypothetical protein BCR33DRAFT_736301 [Rhizoclosmatium globosum]|eukprot:ORY46753.1 hypothetical protein BCR33DRAFT_736301 [Rhizoclosmatium globosum]